ncbi:MAG: type IX secretion system protein PorQ [Prevotella sp.]|nr:type IX secretion system protein PorQ [Bacteroidales bacterium]MDD7704990.1 type IX secretion system protein PorQ [Bacteroidales bacterium]MDY4955295.1 type IX secretion system protein PorQ [Prevotella sp.]MDY5321533.1 type IX secretion system protein PorQ [Prevotella sp.]
MKKVAIILLLALVALDMHAQDSRTEYNFLRLPVSAHAAALGGDNVSIIEDDEALIFSNPALLSSVSDKTINFNYMNYMSGVNMLSAAFNKTVKERASWAGSAQYIDYGSMKETDADNVQTGEFKAKDIALAGYFSYMLTDHLAGGIAMKFVTSYIGDYNSIGMGVDLGVNYYDDARGWSVSAVVKNLGGQLKAYTDNYERMPIDVQIGASKSFETFPMRLSASLVDLNHWDYRFANHIVVGAEFIIAPSIWIGGGYSFRRAHEMKIASTDGESSHGAGLSFGGGLNLDRFKVNLAYGKYHVSSSSLTINVAYSL